MRDLFDKIFQNKKLLVIGSVLVAIVLLVLFFKNKSSNNLELTEYTVSKGSVVQTISASGKIESKNSLALSFGGPGFIEEIKVTEGDTVKKGDVIATLNSIPFESQLDNAKGLLQSSSNNYARLSNSVNQKIQEYSQKNSELDEKIADQILENNKIINENTVDNSRINTEIGDETYKYLDDNLDTIKKEEKQALAVGNDNEDLAALNGSQAEDLAQEQTDLTDIQYDSRVNSAENQLKLQELQNKLTENNYESTKANMENSDLQNENLNEKTKNALEVAKLQTQELGISKKYDLGSIGGQIMSAKANIKAAEYSLDKSKIVAPFDGTILEVPLKVGEYYNGPGLGEQVKIANLNEYIIEAEVNELDILKVAENQKVTIEIEADPDNTYEGTIIKINPAPLVDPSGVVYYQVKISVPEDIKKIFTGLSASLDIVVYEAPEVMVVPSVAIKDKEGKKYVNVKNEKGKVEEREVKVGTEGDTNIEILEGLSEGEKIYY